jgi:hypothetical protein
MVVFYHAFLTTPLDAIECKLHAPAALPHSTHWTGGWVGRRAGEERLLPLPEIKPRFLGRSARGTVTIPTELSLITDILYGFSAVPILKCIVVQKLAPSSWGAVPKGRQRTVR